MSENTNSKNVNKDEIDLLDLLMRMGRAIIKMTRALGRGILISIIFLLRHWIPLFFSVIAGIGIAYGLKSIIPSNYNSDLVLKVNAIPNSEMISYINRLHTFCKEKNIIGLSDAISVDQEKVKNITDICAFWIIDKGADGVPDYVDYSDSHNVYDTVNIRMTDRLDIRVKIRLPQELKSVTKGILNFINSDSLFQHMNRLRLKHNSEMIMRMNYDILQLDSLQKFKYFEESKNMLPKNGGQMIFLQEHNTQLLYDNIHDLYVKKQALENEQALYEDITTTLSDFSIPSRRVNGGTFYALRVVPAVFVITLLILIFMSNGKKLKQLFNKY